jgi:hypothetical protein
LDEGARCAGVLDRHVGRGRLELPGRHSGGTLARGCSYFDGDPAATLAEPRLGRLPLSIPSFEESNPCLL